jgi:hypothetical protein
MSRLLALNLIRLFDFYLILTVILSIYLRYRQYQDVLGLVFGVPNRWPRLFQLVTHHRTIFLTWPTLLPIGLTFALLLVHTLVYNFVWPSAELTPQDLWHHWWGLACVLVTGAAMGYLDFDAIFNAGQLDRPALERDLDQAEYWLRSWVSPAVSILTFGYVDPRRMVHEEVRKALTGVSLELNKMMWRWSVQIGVRLAFGLSLWLTWAITQPTSG